MKKYKVGDVVKVRSGELCTPSSLKSGVVYECTILEFHSDNRNSYGGEIRQEDYVPYILLNGCAFLNGGNWEIVGEDDES